MEVLPGTAEPGVTVVALSSGAPRSAIAPPHFWYQACQRAMPAAICSGVEFANISATEMPLLMAVSERYRTRYLFMSVTSYRVKNCLERKGEPVLPSSA